MEDEKRGVGDLQTTGVAPWAPPTVQGEVPAGRSLVRHVQLPRGYGSRTMRIVDSGHGRSH